jgi:hypothetical protein
MDVFVSARNTAWTTAFLVYPWASSLFLHVLDVRSGYLVGAALTAALDLWRHSGLDAPLAERLELRAGTRVFHSRLVHLEDGVPIQLEERHVNPRVVPDYLSIDFATTTPAQYLQEHYPLREVEHVIVAESADAAIAALLDVPGAGAGVAMPTDTGMLVTGVLPAEATMFKSALYPTAIPFRVAAASPRGRLKARFSAGAATVVVAPATTALP